MTYRLTTRARRDILGIWVNIAENNQSAADRFVDLLTHRFALLGKNPYLGRAREDLRPGYRSFPVGQYLILYRMADPGVRIMQVLHGRRDIATLFEQ
jgi:toxin ParE1/3/4